MKSIYFGEEIEGTRYLCVTILKHGLKQNIFIILIPKNTCLYQIELMAVFKYIV